MFHRKIVLSSLDDVMNFTRTAEKCSFPITLVRPGDVSVYDGKSLLSVLILLGWNIDVRYPEHDENFDALLDKFRVTEDNRGWSDYMMKQDMIESLETGQQDIDAQHHKLIRFFNYLADACEHENLEQAREIGERLEEFTEFHFYTEINLQRISGFPGIEEHNKKHDRLRQAVNYLKESLNCEEIDMPAVCTYIYEIFFPLFFDHIRSYDSALCKYLVEHDIQ